MRAERLRQPLQLALAFALHLLLIVAVVQAWMSGWPGKIWLTIGAVLAVLASGLLLRRWRGAPLIIGCLAVATIFLWPALRFESDAAGLRIGGLPFGTATAVLIVVALAIAALQLWKLASSPRLPRWVRFIPAVFALYAIALIVLGIVRGASPSGGLSGEGPLPWWISGPYLGSAVLLPLGFVVSLVVLALAIARRSASIVSAVAVLVMMLSAFVLSGLELTRAGRPNLAQFIGQTIPQTSQDPGVAKTRALLLAARPGLVAEGRELALAFQQPLHAPGEAVPDRSPAIARLMEHIKTLRTDVESVAVQGAAAISARDLTARALLETEQALGKLAETYAAPDQRSSTVLLAESVRLLKEAKATSAKAGKALNIPWPLQ